MTHAGRIGRTLCSIAILVVASGLGGCRELTEHAPPTLVAVQDVQPPVSPEHTVALIITGQNSGLFEPCGCPGGMRGGLLGRATVVHQLRDEYPNVVQIDTGDQVPAFSDEERYGYRREIRDLTDRAIVDGMRYLGYDAILLTDQDLDWGLKRFGELQVNLPLVAANLYAADGRPLARPYKIVQTHAARVAVVGLVHPEALALLEPAFRGEVRVADPLLTASRVAAELKGQADLLVAVTAGGPHFDARLAEEIAGIDVIVSQPGHQRDESFRTQDRVVYAQSPNNGLDVGVLQLNLDENKHIAATHRRVIEINASVPRDPHLAEVFSALNFQTARLKLAGEKGLSVRALTGADACRDCHPAPYAYWTRHAHANTLQSLVNERREADTLCLPCHVTGYGLAGGYVDLFRTPELANVNCVMCHFVDVATHGVDGAPPVSGVSIDHCAVCHTAEESPRFVSDPDGYLKAATCPAEASASGDSAAAM